MEPPYDDFAAFRARLLAKRRPGRLTACSTPRPGHPVECIPESDRFVSGLGFNPIGNGWREVERREFILKLADVLVHGVSDPGPHPPSGRWARTFAEQFVDLFDAQRKGCFLVNFQHTASGRSWRPISNPNQEGPFAMEAAFVAMDRVNMGLLLFEEED